MKLNIDFADKSGFIAYIWRSRLAWHAYRYKPKMIFSVNAATNVENAL